MKSLKGLLLRGVSRRCSIYALGFLRGVGNTGLSRVKGIGNLGGRGTRRVP
jgi:hypothetical protein